MTTYHDSEREDRTKEEHAFMATTPQDPRAKQLSGFLMPLLSNDMAKLATEQIAAAARPKTPQELRTEQILATLDELGGRNVGEDSIVFTGTQVILPEDMQGKMDNVAVNFDGEGVRR